MTKREEGLLRVLVYVDGMVHVGYENFPAFSEQLVDITSVTFRLKKTWQNNLSVFDSSYDHGK